MWRPIVSILSLFVLIWPAYAQSCSVAATSLGFTPYYAFSGNSSTASANVTVSCSGLLYLGVSYDARLGGGQAGSIPARKMLQASSGNQLGYQVYTETGDVWGNGVQGSTLNGFFALTILGSRSRTFPISGTIPPNQQVNHGSYNDSVVMTVVW